MIAADEQHAAVTAAATAVPTLQQYLDKLFRSYDWGDGRDYQRNATPMKTAAGVAASKRANPDGKVPTAEQALELQQLVERWNERCAPAMTAEWAERKAATLRAIADGRVETSLLPLLNPLDHGVALDAGKAIAARRDTILQRLAERLGAGTDDWVHSVTSTGGPDGVSRECIVYFTRQQEPAFFAARDAYTRLKGEREASFREFFRRL